MDLEVIAREIVRLLRGLTLLLISTVVMLAGLVIVAIGGCFAVMGAGTPVYQSLLWLQEGRWYSFTSAYKPDTAAPASGPRSTRGSRPA
jgi:hypothetical protein